MEKQLRLSLQSSAEEFLLSATKFPLKSSRYALKTLIHHIDASSDLSSSLPLSLLRSISLSIPSFHNPTLPGSPPTKRNRRSSRLSNREPSRDRDDDEKRRISQSLQVFAYVTRLCVSHPRNVFSAADLLAGAQLLHDNLISFESDPALSSEIANLCEQWWKEDLPGRESLISQSLPFFLSRSLTSTTKQDVHRVYALRGAFALFDFEDESIEDLTLLIIRCVVAPLYMKMEEGRRFVAFAFGLSGQLLKELLAMIRSQIPLGGKSLLEAYGDVLFRAWKVADENSIDQIENRFLQELIDGAIHARTESLAASVRRVLGAFINQRTTIGVEKLLFRISEPLIFRSLQVANSNVRQNALHLLLDLFPLEDPDSTKEVKDTLLGKQFYLLEKLLVDDCPAIRVVAVEGSCRILHLFWEIIPSQTITRMLTKNFNDMSHDMSNEVRLSTLTGVIYLLGNPQSHEILKVLLPRLRHLILDNVLSIRRAMMDLLLAIRDIQNFQFNKVVELDVLLDALANDQPEIAQKITRLLMPSYFPSKAPTEEACNRCLALIKRSPMAGARFCEFSVLEGASLKSQTELVKALINSAVSLDKLHGNHVDGLLLAAANLCCALASEPNYKSALKEFFVGEKLKCLFARASTRHAQSSIFKIASTISIKEIAALLDGCMAFITNCTGLSGDVERQAEVRSAHHLLLSCGKLDCMFEVLTSLLQRTVDNCQIQYGIEVPKQGVSSAKRKDSKSSSKISAKWKQVGGKKASNFEEDYSVCVGIAWQIKDLLKLEDTRKAILESQHLESLLMALKVISEVSILQSLHCECIDISPVLAYTTLSLHMTLENVSISGSKDCSSKRNDVPDSSGSNSNTVLEQTLVHMLNCSEKLYGAGDSKKSGKPQSESKHSKNTRRPRLKEHKTDATGQSDAGFVMTEPKRLSNKVTMLTTVLQFMTDATIMGFIFHNHEWGLKFTSDYFRHVVSTLRQQPNNRVHFEDEEVKDTILCLKSSFTYAAKLLSLALKETTEDSPPQAQAFVLANDMLDMITSVELYLGTSNAARLMAAVKPWLPDLVLALGSGHMKQTRGELEQNSSTDYIRRYFPSWLLVLSKTELSELSKIGLEEDDERASGLEEFPAFRKLMESILLLVKRNTIVLDAVGQIFLIGSLVGLEGKDYRLVLGLLHFVCVKLFRHDCRESETLLAFLQEIYPQLERHIEEESDEDARQILESARTLLEPFWSKTENLFSEADD
ncbi:uncharacterized protein LOC21392733 isoform X2 [Morus notabilis]|uniref:uncharacterized protein LOC21392733 isoform X2 n=1 Tax=Morus notabilis TaxID=981085 RepID=UPI000CED33E3|nr:uncharacterized protein LOC21392733 isoform X2 [Morus notabilis]